MKTSAAKFSAAKMPQAISGQYLRAHERVADVAYRRNAIPPQLVSQTPDADIHHVGARVERVAPDVLEQLLARARFSVAAHEVLEQDELARGQRDGFAVLLHDPPAHVEYEAANPQVAIPGRLALASAQPSASDKLGELEGLGHVVAGAELEAHDLR